MYTVITIDGTPIAKKRPRFVRRGKFVQTYNCQETEEGRWLLEAKHQVSGPMDGPLAITIDFAMPRPKAHWRTGTNSYLLKDSAPRCHTSRPDLDNLIKFVKDCLNGVAWNDDSQVCSILARKFYHTHPFTQVRIAPV